MNRIDLHIHTNVSDGKHSFKEIIDMAVKNNVTTISITDHDNIGVYTKENVDYAKENNINLIFGVEISTKIEQCGIHVLGYNIDITNKRLINELNLSRDSRHVYLKDVSKLLNNLGYDVNINKLDKIESVTKNHIADDIINNPNNKGTLIEEFGFIPSRGIFIETLLTEGKKAYVRKKSISPKEATDIIKQAGGKSVLAHPVVYEYEDGLTEKDIKDVVIDMQPDGIECYYIYANKNNKIINDINKWEKFAADYNLLFTIGSDFHFDDGVSPIIGLINVIENENFPNPKKILSNLNK